MCPELPQEIWDLIHAHIAAIRIQHCWSRYILFSHARDPHWIEVRRKLLHWRRLWMFSLVRKEWRTELESWRKYDVDEVTILEEAEIHKLWGSSKTHIFGPSSCRIR